MKEKNIFGIRIMLPRNLQFVGLEKMCMPIIRIPKGRDRCANGLAEVGYRSATYRCGCEPSHLHHLGAAAGILTPGL